MNRGQGGVNDMPQCGTSRRLKKENLRTNRSKCKELLDLVVIEANATVRRLPPYLARVVGAVDQVGGPCQIHRMGAQRITGAGGHVFKGGVTLDH